MAYLGNQPVVGDSTNTFKVLDDISTFTLTFDASSSDVVSVANDTLSIGQHRFITGQKVTYSDGGGTAITGLTDGSFYFIIKEDQTSIKLATSASNAASAIAIDLTGLGTGSSHTLNVKFDGTNTKFKATHTNGTKSKISSPAQLSLSVNGVIQNPAVDYSIESDSTIVFNTAPVTTDKIFGTFIGERARVFETENNVIDEFTGDGSSTTFNLSQVPPTSNDVIVTLDGVVQYPHSSTATRSYSAAGSQLIFTTAPDVGVVIQARHIGLAGASTPPGVTAFYGRGGNVVLTSSDDISVNGITAAGNVSIGGTLTYEDVTNVDSVGLITARSGVSVTGGDLDVDGHTNLDNVSIAGVTTATGNLNISSANLQIGGTNVINSGRALYNLESIKLGDSKELILGTGNDLKIYHSGSHSFIDEVGNGALKIKGDDVRFVNASGTEALRITSTGQVLLGTTTEGQSGADDLTVATAGGTLSHTGITIRSATDKNGSLFFSDGTSGNSEYRGWVQYTHSDGTNDDYLTFGTAADERLRITSDGNVLVGSGITLSPDGDGFFTGITTIRSASFGGGVLQETFHNDTSAVSGTHNHDALTYGMVWNGSTNAGGSFVINLRGDANTTFDSLLGIGKATTMTIYSANNSASNYMTAFQIDGSAQTIKYANATTPSAATGSGVDLYSLTILKTAANTYSVFGNFTNFA